MSRPIASVERSLGTAMSAVRAEPPKARRSIVSTSWRSDAEGQGHAPRGLDLGVVALTVGERQRVDVEAVARGQGGRRGRVDAAAEQHHRPGPSVHGAIV